MQDAGTDKRISGGSCPVKGCAYREHLSTCMDKIRLFAGLPTSAKEELAERTTDEEWPKGAILVHEGDPIESVLIVRKGRIKTFRSDAEGEETVLDVLHDGQAIWQDRKSVV